MSKVSLSFRSFFLQGALGRQRAELSLISLVISACVRSVGRETGEGGGGGETRRGDGNGRREGAMILSIPTQLW